MLVDSHCHLNMEQFHEDLESVLDNAEQHKIECLQTICTKMSEFPEILALAEKYAKIYCSIGVHPMEVSNESLVLIETLVAKLRNPKVIGIGETGLDYYYRKDNADRQKESFIRHILASQQTDKPVIIHAREADEDIVAILKEYQSQKQFPALIHCFTSNYSFAKKVLDLGLYISFAGIVTFKNAQDIQEVASKIPLDRMLVETDAPYLAPVPKRGKRNEPAYTRYTAEYIANMRNIPFEELARQTTNNFYSLFNFS